MAQRRRVGNRTSIVHKELTGIEFFDAAAGGVFAGRCWLLCGPSGVGKSAISLQFLAQGIRSGQRALLLAARPAADSAIWAASYGTDIEHAVEKGELVLLEYSHYVPGRDRETNLMLPTEGFLELQAIIETQAVRRIAIDTVVPWVTAPRPELLSEHIFSFVRAFERLRCTTLLTLPRPASPAAFRIKNAVEDVVPVSITLSIEPQSGRKTWSTTKYLGAMQAILPVSYVVVPGQGAVAASLGKPEPNSANDLIEKTAASPSNVLPPPSTPANTSSRVHFSKVLFSQQGEPVRPSDRGFRFGVTLGG